MSAVTVLCELQKGQLKETSSFGFCFFGGGLDDLRLPMSVLEWKAHVRVKPVVPGKNNAGSSPRCFWLNSVTASLENKLHQGVWQRVQLPLLPKRFLYDVQGVKSRHEAESWLERPLELNNTDFGIVLRPIELEE